MQVKIVEKKMSSLAPAYLASVAFKYELIVCFGCRVVCTRVAACVGIYTHIHALKNVS